MSEKQRFKDALDRKPIKGLVPTFELAFFLTMEAFQKVHPAHRCFNQWNQMSEREKQLQRTDAADVYIQIAETYGHSAIFFLPLQDDTDEIIKELAVLRERSGDRFFIMMHGDPTFAIPSGNDMIEYIAQFYEEPNKIKEIAQKSVDTFVRRAEKIMAYKGLLDGFTMCSDYCFNDNPFLSPSMFSDFITPYLSQVTKSYREMGFYTIKHTDGNILPILDQLVECNPHGLHSLDPQGGVDLADIKRRYGDRVCLIGNVHCGMLQTGTHEEVVTDVLRSLHDGMPGFGYIFSTSNCAYTGLPLERYELLIKLWREHGVYN